MDEFGIPPILLGTPGPSSLLRLDIAASCWQPSVATISSLSMVYKYPGGLSLEVYSPDFNIAFL